MTAPELKRIGEGGDPATQYTCSQTTDSEITALQVGCEGLLVMALKLEKHDSVAELKVGDHASCDLDRHLIEPECGVNPQSHMERAQQPKVASVPAEVDGFSADNRPASLDPHLYGNLESMARITAPRQGRYMVRTHVAFADCP